ncbi:MAG TPA: hypothetical protein V6D21_23340 [Candidatus Obscuribacterales bacterium]
MIWPAQFFLKGLAHFIRNNFDGVPFISNIVKFDISRIKIKYGHANSEEIRMAVIAPVIVAGCLTMILLPKFIGHILIAVAVISVLASTIKKQ